MSLETPRLILRPWEARDLAPFAALNADPEVMRHFPGTLTRERSDTLVANLGARALVDGFGFLAAERRGDGAFLGMIGTARVRMPGLALDGAVEVGWRLARAHWGRGYATEGAAAAIDHAFAVTDAPEVVAFTAIQNLPSQAVMRRLGMRHAPERAFAHPNLPEGSPLRPHVLWTVSRAEWGAET